MPSVIATSVAAPHLEPALGVRKPLKRVSDQFLQVHFEGEHRAPAVEVTTERGAVFIAEGGMGVDEWDAIEK